MSTVKYITSFLFATAFLGSVLGGPILPKNEGKRPELQQFPSAGKNEKELEILDRLANKIRELQHIRMAEVLTKSSPSENTETAQDGLHNRNGRTEKIPLRLVVARVRKLGSKRGDGSHAGEEVSSKSQPDDEEGSYSLRKFELRTTLGDLAILDSLSAKIQDLKDMRKMESLRQELEGITDHKDQTSESAIESKIAKAQTTLGENQIIRPKARHSPVKVSALRPVPVGKTPPNHEIKSIPSSAKILKELKRTDGISQTPSEPQEAPQQVEEVALKMCENCNNCSKSST
jgi:hypothetical protein